jgi:hypothetical protein
LDNITDENLTNFISNYFNKALEENISGFLDKNTDNVEEWEKKYFPERY